MLVDTSKKFEELVKQGFSGLSEEEYIAMQNNAYETYEVDDEDDGGSDASSENTSDDSSENTSDASSENTSDDSSENDSDDGKFKVQGVKIEPTDHIQNSFRTQQFTARNATNCNNSSCIISSYSAFDKLYNQWFSTDIVVTSFGPALLHSAGKWLNLVTTGPGGGAQNKIVKTLNEKVFKKSRDYIGEVPSKLLGRRRVDNYQQLIDKHGFGKYFTEYTVGGKAFSSGGAGYTDALLDPNGPLKDLTAEQKKAFFKALQDIRAYAEVSSSQMKQLTKIYDDGGSSLIDYGRGVAKQIADWDDVTFLDFPAWIKNNPDLTGLQGMAVKRASLPAGQGFVDITASQPFHFTNGILKPFAKNGTWNPATAPIGYDFVTGTGGLQLYKAMPTERVVSGATVSDLHSYLAKLGDGLYTVNVPGTGQMPLNASTIDYIRSAPGILGTVDIFSSKYSPVSELTPEHFSSIITNARIVGRPTTASINFNTLEAGLRQNSQFVTRRALGPLDSVFAKENKLLTDYFTFRANNAAFYEVALGPTLLWHAKRGMGNEKFSAFMLPDEWTTMTLTQGVDEVYERAFVDFYANEGSDQGELLSKIMNNTIFLPNTIFKAAADAISPQIGDKVRAFSGEYGLNSIMRDDVLDIAFYSHNENCSGCTMSVNNVQDNMRFDIYSPVNTKSFIVEAADQETVRTQGSTLIAYSHGSNILGSTTSIDGQEVNLSQARREGITCDQVLRENNLGWAGRYTGFVLASAESVAYFINPGFGVIASGIQQTMIAPKLQNCVDDKEGYYIHFYSPPPAEQVPNKTSEALANENVTSAVSDLTKSVDAFAAQDNPVANSIGKIKEEFDNFAGQAKNNNILQATIELLPPTSGTVSGKEIFYIWYKDNLLPNALKTEGRQVLKDGNVEVVKDFGEGSLTIDGKKVVDGKKEIMGLSTQDNRIPADLIPKKVSTASKPNSSAIVFELNVLGEVRVREEQIKKCIQDAIEAQSGIKYSGDELTQVFGSLKTINTQNYGNVFAKDFKIQLEGQVPVYGTSESRFIIDGFWNSRLIRDVNQYVDAGKFIGMAFNHGSIVLNPENDKIVIWLRQHKESVLTSGEVSGLKAKLSSITDPETECEQPAIELSAEGYPNDQLGLQRVQNFNTSMGNLGPFTQFTTDGKIFEFYAIVDPETGECQDYFRVIDKATGRVLVDSPIVGGITQDADGKLTFRTADGKSHTLEFNADNGIPKLSYNSGPAETLRTAQGPNGSFWFDPNTGQWYPENSMQIPLNQAFKDQGAFFGVDKEGNVTGTAGNPMTFNIGQQGGQGFNIPSLPQNLGLLLFISLFLLVSFVLTQGKNKIKKKK
jgi:hypothetical protein